MKCSFVRNNSTDILPMLGLNYSCIDLKTHSLPKGNIYLTLYILEIH